MGWTFGQILPVALLLTPAVAAAQQSGTGAVPSGGTAAVVKQPEAEAKPQPVVVLPEIVHFEPAQYPPEE